MTQGHGDPAQAVLDRAQHIFDDTLGAVAEWKASHPGGLAVGCLPIYAPRPLFEAMNCLPVAVFGGGDQVDIIRGDSFFQSYICHIPRSIIELGLARKYDIFDAMVFPSICDVIRNLGGMWQILFPEKYVAYLDLPQDFDGRIGGRFYAGELRRIARDLEGIGARPLTAENLRAAIAAENDRMAAQSELDRLRVDEPWKVTASEAYLVVRAGSALPAAEHAAMLRAFVTAAKARATRPFDNVRVVLRGSFCEQPPLTLIRALEKAGCDIIDDDFQLGMRMIDGDIDLADGEDPVDALSRAFLERGRETASRYIADDEKGRALVERIRATKADGAVFAAASFCDPALLDQPMLEAALARAGIPFTSFKFAENTGQFQVIREQAGAFSDAVKLWGAEA